MKFLVELHLTPGSQAKALDIFELRGPNRNPGVTIQQAWVDTRAHIVFVLAHSDDELLVENAASTWSEFGECRIHPVIDIEQF